MVNRLKNPFIQLLEEHKYMSENKDLRDLLIIKNKMINQLMNKIDSLASQPQQPKADELVEALEVVQMKLNKITISTQTSAFGRDSSLQLRKECNNEIEKLKQALTAKPVENKDGITISKHLREKAFWAANDELIRQMTESDNKRFTSLRDIVEAVLLVVEGAKPVGDDVEKIAKAINDHEQITKWEQQTEQLKDIFRETAKAAINAINNTNKG